MIDIDKIAMIPHLIKYRSRGETKITSEHEVMVEKQTLNTYDAGPVGISSIVARVGTETPTLGAMGPRALTHGVCRLASWPPLSLAPSYSAPSDILSASEFFQIFPR